MGTIEGRAIPRLPKGLQIDRGPGGTTPDRNIAFRGPQHGKSRSGWPVSNRRPPPWQGGALPTEPQPQKGLRARVPFRLSGGVKKPPPRLSVAPRFDPLPGCVNPGGQSPIGCGRSGLGSHPRIRTSPTASRAPRSTAKPGGNTLAGVASPPERPVRTDGAPGRFASVGDSTSAFKDRIPRSRDWRL
jgi:hypothetical protein